MASKFTITAELNLQTKNLNQVVNNLRQQFQGANLNINIKDLAQAQSQINKISSSAQNAQKSVGLLGSSFSQAFKKFTIVTAVTGTIVGFTRAVKNAVGDAIEFEREVVKIAQATGKTTSQLKGLTSEISNVSSSFGVSSKELILAARSLTQAGFAADKVTGALKILAQTELAATFDSIQDTTEGAIALLNQFGKQAQRTGSEVAFLEKSFSAINQVSKEFAVESSDLVTAVRTTGSAFESAGGSLDELLALFTSVRATTRESAESIATGFRTIFTRVQRVDTINNLKALGIELQDAEGKFIGPIEATKKLSAALNSIDPRDFRFNLVVEELGGFRQVSKVIPLIQQFAVTQKALNVAQGSSGSLAKDAQTAQQSLAVQIAKTREEFSRFIRDLTGTDSFQSTVRFLLDLASAFVRVADSIKPLVPLIAGFATLKAGTAVKGAFDQLAGPRRKAQGGKIHAFASGGMVPGSGNGDTVPAMLTPGEFVIRKSSVKKLGAENLARANKYAGGGPIQYYEKGSEGGVQKNDISKQYAEDVSSFSINSAARAGSFKEGLQERQKSASKMREKKREYGGAFLRPVGEDTEYTGYVTKAEVLKKAKIKTASSKAKNLEQAKYPFTIKLASVNKNTKEVFQSSILDGIANVVDETSRKVFASSVSTGAVPKDISYKTLKRSNIDQTVGNIFEASIKSLSGKFTNDDKVGAGNQTFDFPDGLGDASKYFDPELSNVKTDAKATYNLQSLQSLVEKVKADIKEEYIPTTKKEIQKVEKNPQNVINRTTATQEQANQDAFKNKIWEEFSKNRNVNLIKAKDNVANFAIGKNSKFTSEFSRIFNLAKSKFNDEASIINFLNENTQPFTPKAKALGGLIHFANGGAASGTDTVPAMLTPGEYVINKKSAQAIGYGSLNRMNKVGKFANGGPVQMFNAGSIGQGAQPVDPYSAFRPKAPSSSPTIDVLSSSLEQSLTKLNESSTKVTNKFGDINDQLLLFGPVIAGAISQMGMFDKATADIISATTFTFSTIKGIGGNLIDLGAGIKGISPGALKGLGAGLTGFASAQAVAAARVTYLGQTAEESGKKFNSFVEALSKGQGTTQGQLAEALTKQFQAASDAQGRSSGAAKAAGGIGALAAGGAATALGAGAFAPVIAAVAGPIIEEGLYQLGAFSDSTGKAKVQAEALAAAMFSATTSNRDFQKFFQNIEKQTPQDVTKQAQSLANAYKDQQSQIAKLGDVAKASDAVKQQFQAVSEAAKLTAANLQTVIGIQLQNAVKKSSDLLNRGFVPDTNKLLKPIFDAIESDVTARYATQINEAGGETTQKGMSLVNIRNKEMAIEQERARKSLNEATKQQLQMIAVLNLENNIRKDLVGSLQKQSAISASIERLSYELDLASKSVSNIDAAFSGSITGLKSSFDTDILKLKSPDQGKLDKALDPVRAIGPIGRDLADNLLNINQVMPTLEAKLIQFSNATDTASGALFDVKKFVEESFNIKADSIVGRTLVKIIEGTTTGTGGEKAVTAAKTSLRQEDVRKKIVESFQKFGEEFRTQAGGILDNLARAEQEGRAVAEKINESRQKQLDLQLQSVDTFSNYIDALARARGRDLSLIEKNTIRTMKQYTLAGNMANNVGAISTELSGIYKKLNEGGLDLDTQKNLSFTATKLKAALEDLANQSGKTSDILAEIEKQRAKRESARDFGKEFTFGSNEQRQSIANSIQGLQRVLTTGNINDVPEELRSGVSSLLDRFKDVPVFNGRTGRQVENKLIANQFRAMGGGAFANMIEADTSTPEQILIGELQRTFAVQIYAQQALSNIEQQKQELLQTALNEYTTAIGSYTVKLEALVQEFQTKAEEKAISVKPSSAVAIPNVGGVALPTTNLPNLSGGSMGVLNNIAPANPNIPSDAKGKIDFENIQQTNAAIDAMDQAISLSETSIYEWTASLNNLRSAFEKNQDRFKEEETRKKQEEARKAVEARTDLTQTQKQDINAGVPAFGPKFANGGIVYRAGGGSIFQPKGTDTVPAMLTPGEFVIKKSSVDKIGADNLSALNNGYASGGLVSYLAGGGGASGTNAINDLAKRVVKLEEQVKKLEKENKTLKDSLGKISPMNQIAGGMQNMQQMMSGMQNPQQMMGAMSYGDMMNQRYSSGGNGTRRQLRARQRGNERAAKDDANYFSVPNAQRQAAANAEMTAATDELLTGGTSNPFMMNGSFDSYGLGHNSQALAPLEQRQKSWKNRFNMTEGSEDRAQQAESPIPVPPQQAAATAATAATATPPPETAAMPPAVAVPVPPQQAAAATATAAAATAIPPGIMSADKHEAILNNPAIMNNSRSGEKPENQLALDLLQQEHDDKKAEGSPKPIVSDVATRAKERDASLSARAKDIVGDKSTLTDVAPKVTLTSVGGLERREETNAGPKLAYKVNALRGQEKYSNGKGDGGLRGDAELQANADINKLIPGAKSTDKRDPFVAENIEKKAGNPELEAKRQLKVAADSAALARAQLEDAEKSGIPMPQDARMSLEGRIARAAKLGVDQEMLSRQKDIVRTKEGGYTFKSEEAKPQTPKAPRDTSMVRPGPGYMWKDGAWVAPDNAASGGNQPAPESLDQQLNAANSKFKNAKTSDEMKQAQAQIEKLESQKDSERYAAQTPQQKLREVNAKIDLMTGTREVLPTTQDPYAPPIGVTPTGKGETGPRGLEGANQLQALDQERQQLMASRESAKIGPQPVSEFKKNAQAEIDKKYQEALAKNEAEHLAIADPSHVNSPDVQKNIKEISEKRSRVNAQREAMDLYFGPEMSYAPVDIPGLSDRQFKSFDKTKEQSTVEENFRKSRELLNNAEFDKKQAAEDAKTGGFFGPNAREAYLDSLKIGGTTGAVAGLGYLGGIGIGAGIVSALPAAGTAGAFGETILPTVTQTRHLGTFAAQLESAGSAALPALESAGSAANTALPMARNLLALPGFAKGGSTDTVPAMLTPGEFVMNKDSVSKYGKSFMEKMNKGGVVPGFASGGYVGYYAGGGIAATIANRKARGMYDGQMATNAQAMQGSMAMRQNMMSNQFANNPTVQQGVMANPMANVQQKPATGNAANAGGGMTDAAQQFSQFVTQFSDAAKMMTGMTMTHKVTVDGQLNIGGINGEAVANQIRDAIGTYVAKLVEDKMGKKMEGPI